MVNFTFADGHPCPVNGSTLAGFRFQDGFPSEIPTTDVVPVEIECINGSPWDTVNGFSGNGVPLNPKSLTCPPQKQGQTIYVSSLTTGYECIGMA